MSMTTQELANQITVAIPDGYVLCICLENGSGWVELEDPRGNALDFFTEPHRDFEATVLDALSHAQAEARA